jgi:regulatory protein
VKSSDSGDFDKARQYAFLLLRYRDRSEGEIIQRLTKKGFPEETACRVRDYLKERGFIDDLKLTEALKRTAIEQKRLGRAGVYRYLVSRGIPPETAREAAAEDPGYASSAAALVERKLRQCAGLDGLTVKRRLWSALAGKGYSPEEIRSAIKDIITADDGC